MIQQSRNRGFESPFVLCGYCRRAVTHRCKCQATPIFTPALVLLGVKKGANWVSVQGRLLGEEGCKGGGTSLGGEGGNSGRNHLPPGISL